MINFTKDELEEMLIALSNYDYSEEKIYNKIQSMIDNYCDPQVEIERAKIQGLHEGIMLIIDNIRKVENHFKSCRLEISKDFIELKNALGMLVYKNWIGK